MKNVISGIICLLASCAVTAQEHNFQWAKSVGGDSASSIGYKITTDEKGNVYTMGHFDGTVDFDPDAGKVELTAATGSEIFILAVDVNGGFMWVKSIKKTSFVGIEQFMVDLSGNVYIAGAFKGTVDFDPGTPTYNMTSANNEDIFMLKLDNAGNFVWAKQIGGGSLKNIFSIATDLVGNIYTTGRFSDTVDFDPAATKFNLVANKNSSDIFVCKLDVFGNFAWAKQIKGYFLYQFAYGQSITADALGNTYITGNFYGKFDFDPDTGTYDLIAQSSANIFVLKLDVYGKFGWVKNIEIESGSEAEGRKIVVDDYGNVYVSGLFKGTVDFDPGSGFFNINTGGNENIFYLKLSPSGDFSWAKSIYFGFYRNTAEIGLSMLVDEDLNLYTIGSFINTIDIDPGSGVVEFKSKGESDLFILKLDGFGDYVWAKKVGGSQFDEGLSIAMDTTGNIYTTGYFGGTVDFNPDADVSYLVSKGWSNAFIQKLGDKTTGINNNYLQNNPNIYPNPSNGIFNITAFGPKDISAIQVYNCLGNLVYEETVADELNSIDLTAYPNGLYIVKMMNDDNQTTIQKIVKQ